MREELIQTGLKVTINDLSQRLGDELATKHILAVQVTELQEELTNFQRVLESDSALSELFQEVQEGLKEAHNDD